MKRMTKPLAAGLLALMAALASCTTGSGSDLNDDLRSDLSSNGSSAPLAKSVFRGEWTVNRQVVDTARLAVDSVLRLRLPEDYLAGLCRSALPALFTADRGGAPPTVTTAGQPVAIALHDLGYSADAVFCTFASTAADLGGTMYYRPAGFIMAIGDRSYRVELLSATGGTAVFRALQEAWTVAVTVEGVAVTSLDSLHLTTGRLAQSVTLFYNTKERLY